MLGTAPGATADLVLISSLLNTQILSSLGYIINTLNDPIINMSFGSCEAGSSQSSFNNFNTLFSQAAGQGISIFVSSGDSEAAGCMSAGGPYTASLAVASPNVLCTPYVTCVGGTQFSDTASPSSYWSSSNGTNYVSALSYIPEGVWNEATSTSSSGVVSYVVEGGGGGASIFATKPTWQVGTGVPADNARDTPDISFSASGHNAYLACLTYSGAVCPNTVTGFGGTSASAPSMAGVLALVNQKLGARQGLFNARLYQLALTTSNGVFHDATPATSGVANCSLTTASTCNTSTPGLTGLTGGLSGAALTTGYDQATGLGSIDVSKLLAALPTFTVGAIGSTSVVSGTSATFTANYTALAGFSATITPVCTVSATFTSPVLPTCTAPTVTLGGTTTTASNTFTIATTRHNGAPGAGLAARDGRRTLGGIALSALLLCLLPRRRTRSYWRAFPVVLVFSAALMAVSGCGGAAGGSGAPAVATTGTSAGTYNVTIVSTGGGESVTSTTTIVVQ